MHNLAYVVQLCLILWNLDLSCCDTRLNKGAPTRPPLCPRIVKALAALLPTVCWVRQRFAVPTCNGRASRCPGSWAPCALSLGPGPRNVSRLPEPRGLTKAPGLVVLALVPDQADSRPTAGGSRAAARWSQPLGWWSRPFGRWSRPFGRSRVFPGFGGLILQWAEASLNMAPPISLE